MNSYANLKSPFVLFSSLDKNERFADDFTSYKFYFLRNSLFLRCLLF
jgi:hypothetical protein